MKHRQLICAMAAALMGSGAAAQDCQSTADRLNANFMTALPLQPDGNIPDIAGVLVHTIHGPGTALGETNLGALNQLPVEPERLCGSFLTADPPIKLPWCGSNPVPNSTDLANASSWTYIRHDTLIHNSPIGIKRWDEVVCDSANNKRYGLIFDNSYMNVADNLGCMYTLDGDTYFREDRGCGITTPHNGISLQNAQGRCPEGMTLEGYLDDFNGLLNPVQASYAGSLMCSLAKDQFDLWVQARQQVDLGYTDWPVDEFVLFNWDNYSANDLVRSKTLVGFYYLTGCAATSDGTAQEAQGLADLFAKWTGIRLPVLNLSNATMRNGGTDPFTCS